MAQIDFSLREVVAQNVALSLKSLKIIVYQKQTFKNYRSILPIIKKTLTEFLLRSSAARKKVLVKDDIQQVLLNGAANAQI